MKRRYPCNINFSIPVDSRKDVDRFDGAFIISAKDWTKLKKHLKKALTPEQYAKLESLGITLNEITVNRQEAA